MGTRLRNLKKDLKVPTKTKAGKTVMRSLIAGKKGLTDVNIDNIARHYGQNIRNHKDGEPVETLKKKILSGYYHASSTDENPRHSDCDPMWCWYQSALLEGSTPAPHSSKNLYLFGMSNELRSKVLRVYLDLTSTELLSRCVKKRTQNPNESLHSKLWRRCLKIKDAKLFRVRFCTLDTIIQHNLGPEKGCLLSNLHLLSAKSVSNLRKRSLTPKTLVCKKKKVTSDAPMVDEPSTSYQAGAF